jgi:diguanylate cyclase (GGDEF)-like protein/PAS domain S-box-containing protein
VLAVATAEVRALLDADIVAVTTVEGAEQRIRAVDASSDGPVPEVGYLLPLEATIAGVALRTGVAQLCHDAEDDERTDARHSRPHRLRSSVIAPLRVDGRPAGVLGVLSRRPGAFCDAHVPLVEVCAAATATRLEQGLAAAEQVALRHSLDDQDRLLRTVFDALDEGIVVRDVPHGRVLLCNEAAGRILGVDHQGLAGQLLRPGWRWRRGDDTRIERSELPTRTVMDTGDPVRDVLLGVGGSPATTRWLNVTALPVRDADGAVTSVVTTFSDVTDNYANARGIADREEMFRVAFDHAPDGMALVSLEPERIGTVLRANAAVVELLRAEEDAVVGQTFTRWMNAEDAAEGMEFLHGFLSGELSPSPVERRVYACDGSTVDVLISGVRLERGPDGKPCVLTHVVDVTEQREHKAALERLALSDSVTGLANRARLEEKLASALATGPVALLLLDLDRFKLVNDSLGHHVGDALLVEVARRLCQVAPDAACVARLGGDEFVVLVEGFEASDVGQLANAVSSELRRPYVLPSGQRIVSTSSIGIATSPPGRLPADLLREADLALYRAKDSGRDRFALCDDELRRGVERRMATESRLRRAIEHGGLRLHVQPVVDLASGELVAAEALVRVEDPRDGLLPPAAFIEVAEETGLVTELDAWVATEAVRMLAASPPGLPEALAVNVSARTLQEPAFAELLAAALAEHGVAGSRLLVEITESVVLNPGEQVRRSIAALRALGVHLGIDDFGTGYSALAYLQRLRLDFLKIDRSFVVRLGDGDQRAEATVRAIVDLAHAHGLVVTAEGVETEAQAAALRRIGCDRGQGWLFGRPAPPPAP